MQTDKVDMKTNTGARWIYSSGMGFRIGRDFELDLSSGIGTLTDVDSGMLVVALTTAYIIAEHATEEKARAALKAAQEAEKLHRPFWQAAVEHELRLCNMMMEAVHAAARGE